MRAGGAAGLCRGWCGWPGIKAVVGRACLAHLQVPARHVYLSACSAPARHISNPNLPKVFFNRTMLKSSMFVGKHCLFEQFSLK